MIRSRYASLFTRVLFCWHRTHYRDMPWRTSVTQVRTGRLDPYQVLVSEVMLQQTQVSRVVPKYREFIRAFPDLRTLARSSLGDVLRSWSGLGYNRRAKYLHECARRVVADHGGRFPKTMEALMELPGIGRSTAAGIMAFAWNKPEPMIDTNVRRILTRVFYRGKKIQPSDHELYLLARSLIPEGRGREWNYAMLDLGATECTARNHSMACPLIPLHGGVKESVRGRSSEPFRESRRFLRGEIIRRVIALEGRGITERALLRDLPTSSHDAEDLIARLISEGLLARKNGRVSLSGEGDHLRRQKQ